MAVITVRAKDLTVAPIWATPYLPRKAIPILKKGLNRS